MSKLVENGSSSKSQITNKALYHGLIVGIIFFFLEYLIMVHSQNDILHLMKL